MITKTSLVGDVSVDNGSVNVTGNSAATTNNTNASVIDNSSPLKCAPPTVSTLIGKEDYDSSATVSSYFSFVSY